MGRHKKSDIEQNTGISLSQTIVSNRIKQEKGFANTYDVSVTDLAEFFQVPSKVIEKDIAENDIKFTGKKHFDVNKEKHSFYNVVTMFEKEGLSKEEALASIGMWTEPEYFGEKTINYKGFTKNESSRIGKGVQMAKYGYTKEEIQKTQNLNKVEMEFVKREAGDQIGKNVDFAKGESFKFATGRKEAGDKLKDIGRVSGINQSRLKLGDKAYKKHYEKYSKKSDKDISKTEEYAKLMKETYLRWKNKECTQQELADELGVARVTIGNWCRMGKANDRERLNEMPSLRQKNITRAAKQRKDEFAAQVINSYNYKIKDTIHSKAVYAIAKELDSTYQKVLGVLREHGLVATKFENYRGKKDIPTSSEFYKDAYKLKNKSHFGYGPNAGKSIVFGMSYVSTQKELGFELDNQPKARVHADKHKGDMTKYWSQKEADKKEKIEEDYER